MAAQPIGSVRPATTMPASQTSQGPRRVVSSATTTAEPGGSSARAAWISCGLTTAWSNGGPVHQRRTRVSRARARPACSAGKACARAAGVTRWASSRHRTAQATVCTTVACVLPSLVLTHSCTCSYPTAEAVICGPSSIIEKLIQDQYTPASFSCPFSKREHSPGGSPPSGRALAWGGDLMPPIDLLNCLLLRGRELRIQRLTEMPIELRREGRRLPHLLPFRRQLPPPPRRASGVDQQRDAYQQQPHLPREPPLDPRSLGHDLLPLVQERRMGALQPLGNLHLRAFLRLLEGRRGALHRLGERVRGPGVEIPTGLRLLPELLHHLGGLLPCLPQCLEQHREIHEIGIVLLRACHGLPSSI